MLMHVTKEMLPNYYLRHLLILCGIIFLCVESNKNICEKLEDPYFGYLVGDCDGLTENGNCSVVCEEGFAPTKPNYRICNSSLNRWSPNRQLACLDRKFRCPRLRLSENGFFLEFCSNLGGSRCKIGCRYGYELIGSQEVVCSRSLKTWTPSIPKCKKQFCPPLPKFPHARPTEGRCNSTSGAVCRYLCSNGRLLLRSSILRCSSAGRWSGTAPTCATTCPTVRAVSNGQLFGRCTPGIAGRSCYLLCNKGYHLTENNSSITCKEDGKWNSSFSRCEPVTCSSLTPPENGSMTGYCTQGRNRKPCLFNCNYGFKLTGSSTVYCRSNGNWSAEEPICEEITCPDVDLKNVESSQGSCTSAVVDTWCNVTCFTGFRTSGNSSGNLLCLDTALWSSNQKVCRKRTRCPELLKPTNGWLADCNYYIGGKCRQLCHPDFVPVGPAYRICLPSGVWDGARRKCVKKSDFKSEDI